MQNSPSRRARRRLVARGLAPSPAMLAIRDEVLAAQEPPLRRVFVGSPTALEIACLEQEAAERRAVDALARDLDQQYGPGNWSWHGEPDPLGGRDA